MENQEYPNRRHYGYGVDSFLKIIYRFTQKHRCCWQMKLEANYVGDKVKMWATVLTIFVTNIRFVTGLDHFRQDLNTVTNIKNLSPTWPTDTKMLMTTVRCCRQILSIIQKLSPFGKNYLSCRDSRDCLSSTGKFILEKKKRL